MAGVPHKETTILHSLKLQKDRKIKKQDLISSIIQKNQRAKRITHLRLKYLDKVGRQNHQILEIRGASQGKFVRMKLEFLN